MIFCLKHKTKEKKVCFYIKKASLKDKIQCILKTLNIYKLIVEKTKLKLFSKIGKYSNYIRNYS